MLKKTILAFLCKYFFILKAAADGWNIIYIGGNQFTFFENINKKKAISSINFIDLYKHKILDNMYMSL